MEPMIGSAEISKSKKNKARLLDDNEIAELEALRDRDDDSEEDDAKL